MASMSKQKSKCKSNKISLSAASLGFFIISIIFLNSGTFSLSRCRFVYCISMLIFAIEYIKAKRIYNSWFTVWTVYFVIFNIIEIINTAILGEINIKNIIGVFMFALTLIFVCFRKYNAKEMKWIINSLIFTGISFSLILIFKGYGYAGYAGRRTVKILKHEPFDPNIIAAFILLPFMLAVILFFQKADKNKLKNVRKRYICLLAIIIQGTAIFLTSSRGAFVSIIIGILFICIFYFIKMRDEHRQNLIIKGLSTSIVLCYLIYAWMPQSQINRLLLNSYTLDGGGGRLSLWYNSLRVIIHKPIFGYGFIDTTAKYKMVGISDSYAHNTYLLIFETYGFFGGLIYLSLYVMITWKLLKMKNKMMFGFWLASCISIFFFGSLGGIVQIIPLIIVVTYINYIVNGGKNEEIFI